MHSVWRRTYSRSKPKLERKAEENAQSENAERKLKSNNSAASGGTQKAPSRTVLFFVRRVASNRLPDAVRQWPMDFVLTGLASLLAGFIDSIVGGGGLVMVPALLATFPGAHPATLFGTNKAASVWGTGFAAAQYTQRVQLNWRVTAPAAIAGFSAALAGAWMLTVVSAAFLRQLLPVILVLLLLYTLVKKDLGRHHAPHHTASKERTWAIGIGALIGFYDGFFGPGTGSFLVFAFVRLLGYDFLHATASAKILNTATNLAALALFAAKGHVWWHFAVSMAIANVVGSLAGTRLALRHGTGFVRVFFLLVVGALIVKTSYDAYLR